MTGMPFWSRYSITELMVTLYSPKMARTWSCSTMRRASACVRTGSAPSSPMMSRTGWPLRPPRALISAAQARSAGGMEANTVPITPLSAPKAPRTISDFFPVAGCGVPGVTAPGPVAGLALAAGPWSARGPAAACPAAVRGWPGAAPAAADGRAVDTPPAVAAPAGAEGVAVAPAALPAAAPVLSVAAAAPVGAAASCAGAPAAADWSVAAADADAPDGAAAVAETGPNSAARRSARSERDPQAVPTRARAARTATTTMPGRRREDGAECMDTPRWRPGQATLPR